MESSLYELRFLRNPDTCDLEKIKVELNDEALGVQTNYVSLSPYFFLPMD